MVKRVLVDLSIVSRFDAGTGIQRVVNGVYNALIEICPPGFEVVGIRAGKWTSFQRCRDASKKRIATFGLMDKLTVQSGDIFIGLDLSLDELPKKQAQISRWKHAGIPIYIVIYDLLPLHHPEWFSAGLPQRFLKWLDFVAEHATGVICISQTVADKWGDWLAGHRPDRMGHIACGVVRLGAALPSMNVGSPQLSGLSDDPFVLMVGTIEPRKGYYDVLDAFDLIWKENPQLPLGLVIVGRPGWNTDELQARLRHHRENGHRLIWLDHADDHMLADCYRQCRGVIAASLDEGFGLPLVEGAHFGKKVLARDIPIFREVAKGDVTFFENSSASALAPVIKSWASSATTNRNDHNLQIWSWQDSAEDILAFAGISGGRVGVDLPPLETADAAGIQ